MIERFAERLALVILPRSRSYDNPLRGAKGERLMISPHTSEWPGWLWCTTSSGQTGWVPEVFVERDADHAILLRDYDAVELSVNAGESLTVLNRIAGWAWCRTSDGRLGWVPDNCLAL